MTLRIKYPAVYSTKTIVIRESTFLLSATKRLQEKHFSFHKEDFLYNLPLSNSTNTAETLYCRCTGLASVVGKIVINTNEKANIVDLEQCKLL